MWSHAVRTIRCPGCRGELRLLDTDLNDFSKLHQSEPSEGEQGPDASWIDSGALICHACAWAYPVKDGVPILLTYPTQLAAEARAEWPERLRSHLEENGMDLPAGLPPRGEEFVAASFSTEWDEYDYGATLWTASASDRLQTFRGECGVSEGGLVGKRYCEIGCGLGITTNEAADGLGAEAWGVDLSSAVFRAAKQFRENRNLHFVQASVFALPFEEGSFDFMYSHGVLHHTWSTEEAVRAATTCLGRGGTLYLWLYGEDDVRITAVRHLAYQIERVVRPLLARSSPRVATTALLPLVPLYQLASLAGTRSGTHDRVYSVQQALHAARDRFTPMFAHRHTHDEVSTWLEALGFRNVERVSGSEVSESWSLAIDRNVAVRASARDGAEREHAE